MSREPASTALATLADYERQADRFIVLHPVVQMAEVVRSDALRESISIVQVDPKPSGLDVYHSSFMGSQEAGLTSYALQKIANAAGVRLDAMRVIPESEGGLPRSEGITVQVTGYVRQPNGEWVGWSKTKEIDLTVEAEKERKAWLGKRKDGRLVNVDAGGLYDAQALEDYVRGRLLQIREHIVALAETKCQSRVIRAVLALPQVFSYSDLQRPFVVPRLVARPDLADPLLLEKAEREAERAERELYGPPRQRSEVQVVRGDPGTGEEPAGAASAAVATAGSSRRTEGEAPAATPPKRTGRKGTVKPPDEPEPEAEPFDQDAVKPHPFAGDEADPCTECGWLFEHPVHPKDAGAQGTLA
jgi:hypothetical protein